MEDLCIQAHSAETLRIPDVPTLDTMKIVWSKALRVVPTDQLESTFYDALEAHPDRVPKAPDVLKHWQANHSDNPTHQAWNDPARQDGQHLRMLPPMREAPAEKGTGAGRAAFMALTARLSAGGGVVICDCGVSAQLTSDSRHWECGHAKCGFYWSVDETDTAPRGNFATPVDVPIATPQPRSFPPLLCNMADNCNIDLQACDAAQIEQLYQFAEWWSSKYDCIVTRQTMEQYWPEFVEHTQGVLV